VTNLDKNQAEMMKIRDNQKIKVAWIRVAYGDLFCVILSYFIDYYIKYTILSSYRSN
jgi:hypothetical protein